MIKIENVEVTGWEAAIRGMRNPKNSWDRSDSELGCEEVTGSHRFCRECYGAIYINGARSCCRGNTPGFVLGLNDYDLMTRLRNAGTDHRKFMRMITIYLDITAPLYWWKEFDTYKVGTVANSCSTMHKIAAKKFTLEDFSHEHLFKENDADDMYYSATEVLKVVIEMLNTYRKEYNVTSEKLKRTDLTEAERKHTLAQQKLYWWQMIQLLPSSYNQRRTVMLNYEVLANIYKSRKNHKLDEWCLHETPEEHEFRNKDFTSGMWGFCDWIESLPCSELITGKEKN